MKTGKGKRESSVSSDRGIAAKLLKMQKQMRQTRADLAGETVKATAANGAVTITVTGDQRVKEIRIAPEFLKNGDSEKIADILVTVVNDAMEKSQTLAARRLEKLTGGVGMPGQ